MSTRYFELEDSSGKVELETATGGAGDPNDFLIEDATTTPISKTFTYKYDILAFVSKVFTYLYDITGVVSRVFNYIYDINDDGSNVLEQQKGTVTSTILGSINNEVCFITKTDGPRHYSIYIFVNEMQAGDEIVVTIEIKDPVSDTWKQFEEHTLNYNDIDSDVAPFEVFIPANSFRVCLNQTKGALRNYNWALYKSK